MKRVTITFVGSMEIEAQENNAAVSEAFRLLREDTERSRLFLDSLEATDIQDID